MINIKTPENRKTLNKITKQQIVLKNIQKKLTEQQYLSKRYLAQIELFAQEKNRLIQKFDSFAAISYEERNNWSHQKPRDPPQYYTNSFNDVSVLQNQSKLSQSKYYPQSPSIRNFDENPSPIRKLNLSSSGIGKKMGKEEGRRHTTQSIKLVETKNYSKGEELESQICQLEERIEKKEEKGIKVDDEIGEKLKKKIEQQQRLILNEIERWKTLYLSKKTQQEIIEKMKRLKQLIFRQKQGTQIIKNQKQNRNKEIIIRGYTEKMMKVISEYGGSRQA